MPSLREQLVAEALSWCDTPWHHMAMVKGVGCDCVKLLEACAKACGLLNPAWRGPQYSQQWHLHQNQQVLLDVFAQVGMQKRSLAARQPGDALLFQFGRTYSHAAILVASAPDYIVHAAIDHGRVVCHRLGDMLQQRLRACYAFPGIDEDSV